MPKAYNEFRSLAATRSNWTPQFTRDDIRPDLESWRTMTRAELNPYGVQRQYVNMLISKTRFEDDARKALVIEAALEENGPQTAHKRIRVAMALGGNNDLTLSWLAFAAMTLDKEAIAMLLAHLGEFVIQEKRRWPRLKALRVMYSWFASHFVSPLYKLDLREHATHALRIARAWEATAAASGIDPDVLGPGLKPATTPKAAAPAKVEKAEVIFAADPSMEVLSARLEGDNAKSWNFLQAMHLRGSDADPALIRAVLLAEFPWCEDAVAALLRDIELRRSAGRQWIKIRPTLFVGPAGTGKTSFVRRFAELAQLGFATVNIGGASDNRSLQGTARGWSSANPSFVLHAMRATSSANPVIMLDELDKAATGTRNGSVHQTLLSMLEPTTSRSWTDECLQVPLNLSAVNWIATANDLDPLKGPLLSRLRVIEIGAPGADAFEAVYHGILRDIAQELEIDLDDLPELEPESVNQLRRAFQQGWPIRRLRAAMEGALQAAAPRARALN